MIPKHYEHSLELYDQDAAEFNVGFTKADRTSEVLSNFYRAPFILDGVIYESVEGFIQSLKAWEEEDQNHIATLAGYEAKKAGKAYRGLVRESGMEYTLTYQGIQIPYRSEEAYGLIERAIKAKFEQNPVCLQALLETGRKKLTHIRMNENGTASKENPLTSLPADIFTGILMKIRQEYQNK